jgi:hypothetical protein
LNAWLGGRRFLRYQPHNCKVDGGASAASMEMADCHAITFVA